MEDLNQLQAQLDELRAKREQAEAERDAATKLARLREEIEAEQRAASELEVIAEHEEKHGPLGTGLWKVATREGMILLKRPHMAIYRRFADKGKTDTGAYEALVRPCLVYPDRAKFDHILEVQPATLIRCADAVCTLAGHRRADAEGK